MRRTDTADRLRTCDLLHLSPLLDGDLRKQTTATLPDTVLVEDLAACATHRGCIAVAVANPHSSLSDQPTAVLHVKAGRILTWTGNYLHVGPTGFRPGGVNLDRPTIRWAPAPASVDVGATVTHPATGRPVAVHRIDRTLTTIGVRYADDTYTVHRRAA